MTRYLFRDSDSVLSSSIARILLASSKTVSSLTEKNMYEICLKLVSSRSTNKAKSSFSLVLNHLTKVNKIALCSLCIFVQHLGASSLTERAYWTVCSYTEATRL